MGVLSCLAKEVGGGAQEWWHDLVMEEGEGAEGHASLTGPVGVVVVEVAGVEVVAVYLFFGQGGVGQVMKGANQALGQER